MSGELNCKKMKEIAKKQICLFNEDWITCVANNTGKGLFEAILSVCFIKIHKILTRIFEVNIWKWMLLCRSRVVFPKFNSHMLEDINHIKNPTYLQNIKIFSLVVSHLCCYDKNRFYNFTIISNTALMRLFLEQFKKISL